MKLASVGHCSHPGNRYGDLNQDFAVSVGYHKLSHPTYVRRYVWHMLQGSAGPMVCSPSKTPQPNIDLPGSPFVACRSLNKPLVRRNLMARMAKASGSSAVWQLSLMVRGPSALPCAVQAAKKCSQAKIPCCTLRVHHSMAPHTKTQLVEPGLFSLSSRGSDACGLSPQASLAMCARHAVPHSQPAMHTDRTYHPDLALQPLYTPFFAALLLSQVTAC